jgi:hypothetical protein
MAHQAEFTLRECIAVNNVLISRINRLEECLKAMVLSGDTLSADGHSQDQIEQELSTLESAKRALQ